MIIKSNYVEYILTKSAYVLMRNNTIIVSVGNAICWFFAKCVILFGGKQNGWSLSANVIREDQGESTKFQITMKRKPA